MASFLKHRGAGNRGGSSRKTYLFIALCLSVLAFYFYHRGIGTLHFARGGAQDELASLNSFPRVEKNVQPHDEGTENRGVRAQYSDARFDEKPPPSPLSVVVSEEERKSQSIPEGSERSTDSQDIDDTPLDPPNDIAERTSGLLWNVTFDHRFFRHCKPSHFVMDPLEIADVHGLVWTFTSEAERHRGNNERPYAAVTVDGVPCATNPNTACCKNKFWLRFGSTDVNVFDQVINQHFLKLLYPFSESQVASDVKFILDAGANCGISTYILKALFPTAMIVSLEPDAENFKMLTRNTEQLDNVHILNGGLWNETTKIKLSGNHGDWGRVFKKVPDSDKDGMLAYSIRDLLKKFDIPNFDMIKMDIEGSEAVVLASDSDISWLGSTNVLFMEVHDFFAGYFGLGEGKEVTNIVHNAISKTAGFVEFSDNEHTLFIQEAFLQRTISP